MARIRSVHPSLFTDEAWVSCSMAARLLLIGLWTDADDQGVFEWKPLQIKMRLLPADNLDVSDLLTELEKVDLIRRYAADDAVYGAIGKFQKVQRPQKPKLLFPTTEGIDRYLTGERDPEPDLFGSGRVQDQSRTGNGKSNQMEGKGEEDGIGGGKGRARRKPETPIPDAFPGPAEIEAAEQMCAEEGTKVDIPWQAKRFRTWAEQGGKTYRDWKACWRGWIERTIRWEQERQAPNVVNLNAVSDERQRAWMQDFLAAPHQWRVGDRGPSPDQDGCRISASIMAEFGYTPPRRAKA